MLNFRKLYTSDRRGLDRQRTAGKKVPVGGNRSDDVEAQVSLAYRAVLRRNPDPGGLATYAQALRDGKDLRWLLQCLADCAEFQSNLEADRHSSEPQLWFEIAPPMAVDVGCSSAQLASLWQYTASTWSKLGEADAHWSVLTEDRYKAATLGSVELEEFYASGKPEVNRLNAWLRRAGIEPRVNGVCAEYGCGVGRITHELARQHARVIAFDVSEPHLRKCRAYLADEEFDNVEFCQVRGAEDLAALSGLDVFYSVISLQHSPPPIILDVLAHAFHAIRPGGYAFFQVPTYAREYTYSAAAHLIEINEGHAEMEMHFVPQQAIFDLAHRAGLVVVEVQPDACIGNFNRWISNTFLLVRP